MSWTRTIAALSISAAAIAGCCRPSSERSSESESKPAPTFPHRLVSPDGYLAIHYPDGFEPATTKTPAGSSVVLKSGGASGTVTFVSKPEIGLDQDSFVKQFYKPTPDESDEHRAPSTCAGKPGLEIRTILMVNEFPFVSRRCYAVANGTGIITSYTVMKRTASEGGEAKLRAIADAAELLK